MTSEFDQCRKCGKYTWRKDHTCTPFTVWCPDFGEDNEDGVSLYAIDHEAAAERWAEEHDRDGDYEIVEGRQAYKVHVVEAGDDRVFTFKVRGRIEHVYTAETE